MQKWCKSLCHCLILSLPLAGCANDQNTNAISSNHSIETSSTPESTAPSSSITQSETHTASSTQNESLLDADSKKIKEIADNDFKQGVYIDFESYKQSFFNEDLILRLKGTLESIISQDYASFQQYMHEDSYPLRSLFFDSADTQYMFYDIDAINRIDNDGRHQIEIGIRYARKLSDGTIQNTGNSFFFIPNTAGKWVIANID